MPHKTRAERFWSHVDKSGDCWIWLGAKDENGYGKVGAGDGRRATLLAHRVSWELVNGHISDGLFCLHRCDNPPCVNPKHLFLGTQRINIEDMVRKGRQRTNTNKGEFNSGAKLDEAAVKRIRIAYSSGKTYWGARAFAKQLNISCSAVCHAARRITWGHVK